MTDQISVVPSRLMPEVSAQLAQEVARFLRWGYLVVENALTDEQVQTVRIALADSFARKKTEFIHQLLEEDDRFAFLIDNPPVLSRIKAILGECIQLHSCTARMTKPGTPDQGWHRDGPWPVNAEGTPYGSIPGQINCGYYVDALTEANGPILVVPGSHRVPFRPPDGPVRFPDEQVIFAKPGHAVLFDGWLYHSGGANRSEQTRSVALMCYQNAWMKSRESFSGERVVRLREQGGPERKLLLGAVASW